MDRVKRKNVLLVVFAIVFLVGLIVFKNRVYFSGNIQGKNGLVYGNSTLENFVNTDSDGDTILDWEESLFGTDPSKRDSDGDGIEDKIEIAELRQTASATETENGETGGGEEFLTQTDQLSRELFATVVALSQVGKVDQKTAEELTDSVAQYLKNSSPERVYALVELNIITDSSSVAMQKYVTDISNIYKKYPAPEKTVMDVLVEFVGDGETENLAALSNLQPIAEQTSNVVMEMVKMSVPSEISTLHLKTVNTLELLKENIESIALMEIDPIVAMGGIAQYEDNTVALGDTLKELGDEIIKRLSN